MAHNIDGYNQRISRFYGVNLSERYEPLVDD